MTGEVVMRFGFGLGLGAASSMLPGPCYLAVVTAARRGRPRALATGFGAALGDLSCAALGVTGAGLALARPPAVTQALQLAGGLGMIVYGLAHARTRAVASSGAPAPARRSARTSVGGGVATGLSTVLVNPGTLVTWILLTGATLAGDPSAARWAGVLGIGLGSFASYAAVGHWGGASGRVSQVTAVVSRLLVVAGAITLARIARGWLSS